MQNSIIEKPAKKVLLRGLYKYTGLRNLILIVTTALTMIIFGGGLSFLYARVNTEKYKIIYERGGVATAWLENGFSEQETELSKLSFVRNVGHEKIAGTLLSEEQIIGNCIFTDEKTFDNFIKPAYGEICGKYPNDSNEIMLSMNCLKKLGISTPRIGMKINLNLSWYGLQNDSGIQQFILSGFYQSNQDETGGASAVYISQKYLDENNIKIYPSRILIDVEGKLNSRQIKKLLYENIYLLEEDQIITSMDSLGYEAYKEVFGSYGIAILLSGIVMISLYLFVYNVMLISFGKDIKQYKLLNLTGVTKRQIMYLMLAQGSKIAVVGISTGVAIGYYLVLNGIPFILKNMYQTSIGGFYKIQVFSPILLSLSVLMTFVCVQLAIFKTTRNMLANLVLEKQNCETTRNLKILDKFDSVYTRKKRNVIASLAFKNLTRSGKKLLISIISLFLGFESAICVTVIVKGVDNINLLEENPDFIIGITKDALMNYPYAKAEGVKEETIFDYSLFAEEDIETISKLTDVTTDKMNMDIGYFAKIDDVKESDYYAMPRKERPSRSKNGFAPLYNSNYPIWDGSSAGYYSLSIIQVLTVEQLEQLGMYAEINDIVIDINDVINANGVLIIHDGILSEKQTKLSEDVIGTGLYLYPAFALYAEENTHIEKGNLINCGYLDASSEDFPVNRNWKGKDILYFYISEKTFQQLQAFPCQVFQISFDVNKNREKEVKAELNKWIEEKNNEFKINKMQKTELFYLICNSDIIADKRNYLDGSKTIMLCISIALIIVGIMNYFNTVITNILTRKQEFFVLKMVGMTKKNIYSMILYEGLLYWVIICLFTVTIGNFFLNIIKIILPFIVDYFKFTYPYMEYIIIFFISLLICVIVPAITYQFFVKNYE